MALKKVLIPVLGCLILNLAGIWAATQWVASMLGYQPQLGTPLLTLGKTPVYPPVFLAWYLKYNRFAPKQFDLAFSAIYAGAMLNLGVSVIALLVRDQNGKGATTHGSARWARN